MTKKTNKILHSDTPKLESDSSQDNFSVVDFEEVIRNQMKKGKARKDVVTSDEEEFSRPSKAIARTVRKLTTKKDENLSNMSRDGSHDEDSSISDLLKGENNLEEVSEKINKTEGNSSTNSKLGQKDGDITRVSEKIKNTVGKVSRGKSDIVDNGGHFTEKSHEKSLEDTTISNEEDEYKDVENVGKVSKPSEIIEGKVRKLSIEGPKIKKRKSRKKAMKVNWPFLDDSNDEEKKNKKWVSMPSRTIEEMVEKLSEGGKSPFTVKKRHSRNKAHEGIWPFTDESDDDEDDEEEHIERVSKPSEIIGERIGKLSNGDQSPFIIKKKQSRQLALKRNRSFSDESDYEEKIERRSMPSEVLTERVVKISNLHMRTNKQTEPVKPQETSRKRDLPRLEENDDSNDDDDEEDDGNNDDDDDDEEIQDDQEFVKQKNLNAKDDKENNETPAQVLNDLFKASSEETVLKTFHQLIHMGENLNQLAKDRLGRSVLHKAVEKNFLSVVEKLLDYDFDPLCYDKAGEIPLHIAIRKGYDEMAALIVHKLKNFIVRRIFGDNKSNAFDKNAFSALATIKELVKDSLQEINLKHTKRGVTEFGTFNENIVKPMFTIDELIENDLDQTLLRVLDSFLEEQQNGLYTVHNKLLDIDDNKREPIQADFDFKWHTTFHKMAFCNKKDALNHPAVRTYVEHKWTNWCQKRFLRYFFLYLFSLFCWTYSAVTGVTAPDIHTYDTKLQHSRAFFEAIAYLFALTISFSEILQIFRQRRHYFSHVFNILELTSAVILVMVLPLRYINVQVHWYFFAIGYCLWGIRIFKYSIVFNATGIYAEVIKRIIVQDFLQFSALFAVVNLIFSGTFMLILKADDNLDANAETSSFQGTMYVGLRTLIEAAAIVDYSGADGYRTVGTILMLVYMCFTIVVLLNILIAQVSETYTRTHDDCVKTVRANRAWTIARAERDEWYFLPRKPNRVKHYTRCLDNIDLKAIEKKESTPIEIMTEKIIKIQNKQIKDGLEIQTVKTRLHRSTKRIENKVDKLSRKLSRELKEIKQLINGHNTDTYMFVDDL